jgi:phage-related holin
MGNLFKAWLNPTVEVLSSTSVLTKVGAATVSFIFASVLKALTPSVIGTVVLLVLIDTITGLVVAVKKKKVSSKKWYKSLIKLSNYCALIIVGGLAGDISLLSWLSSTFLLLIVITELISILENISIIQPDLIPENIIRVLHLLKD